MSENDNPERIKALHSLKSLLRPEQILSHIEEAKNFALDWTRFFAPHPLAVAFPETTADVVQIVKWARQNKIPLVPSGGRTGLSGGAVASQSELVVSFERMNQILELNPFDQTLRVEAGVVTQEVQQRAEAQGFFYPIDFGAKGSSQIGGNIATNAGGVKVVRYGLTRDWVASLEVVTGSGEVLELNQALIKNATGYDFRHLFIGSEGTLGFITKATLRLAPAPPPYTVMVFGLADLKHMMDVFLALREKLTLTAFELFSDLALQKVLHHRNLPPPFQNSAPYNLLIEIENPEERFSEPLMQVFEHCLEQGWLVDGIISQSDQQSKDLWALRESISESLAPQTPYKNDISVRTSQVTEFIEHLQPIFNHEYPDFEVVWFGHVGDGNLHINILKPENLSREEFYHKAQHADKLLFTELEKFHGSISAEHGVGLVKKSHLSFTRSPYEIELMKSVKKLFDPDLILNPGKVFDIKT